MSEQDKLLPFEVGKLTLKPGDVLLVKVKGKPLRAKELQEIQEYFKTIFPQNEAVIYLDEKFDFTVAGA